jgi:hypothetical protein
MPDGRVRALASKYIEGELLGPFRYWGTRSDDPNDIVPHELRRELRGLRLMAAWLDHDDTRAQNTQDTWVKESGKHFIRHYLMDFGSAMGSGYIDDLIPNTGFNYWIDPKVLKKSALSLGFASPRYRKVKWPDHGKYPAAGRYQAHSFDPETWVGDYPNPAFVRMTDRDGFWAAKLIMSFAPEELRAIVATAQYSDPATEDYVYETLLARQRMCGKAFLNRLNPLDGFRATRNSLRAENLSEKYGLGASGAKYSVWWFFFDNEKDVKSYQNDPVEYSRPVFPIPEGYESLLRPDFLLGAEIRGVHPEHPEWNRFVRVFIRPEKGGLRVIGIDRESGLVGYPLEEHEPD